MRNADTLSSPLPCCEKYLYKGAQGTRPPSAASQDGEEELLQRIQALAPQYRTRPSALLPVVRATGAALGVLSAVLPRPYSEAIKGMLLSCHLC